METEIEKPEIICRDSATIKLSRGMKGQYGWEIKRLDNDVKELKKTDDELREEYGEE